MVVVCQHSPYGPRRRELVPQCRSSAARRRGARSQGVTRPGATPNAVVLDFLEARALQNRPLPCGHRRRRQDQRALPGRRRGTGLERFNPEGLFKIPGKIGGRVENVMARRYLDCPDPHPPARPRTRVLEGTATRRFPDANRPGPFKRGYKGTSTEKQNRALREPFAYSCVQ